MSESERMRTTLEQFAPGTPLRQALDTIISGRTGALILIGDEPNVLPLCDGGFVIGAPFSPQRLFELAKMDGAIVLDAACDTILRANVHLQPDARLATSETGMRHRTAERVSRQTAALVISISQRRDLVTLWVAGRAITIEQPDVVLAKANQALRTLERYKDSLESVEERLSIAEFEGLVTVRHVTGMIRRHVLVARAARWVERYIAQLGTDGRLVRMQVEELMAGVDRSFLMALRDYSADSRLRSVMAVRDRLVVSGGDDAPGHENVVHALGLPISPDVLDTPIVPRGYRPLSNIPMLPTAVQNRLVERFGTLAALLAASREDLDRVDGVGARRANAIHTALHRMQQRVAQ